MDSEFNTLHYDLLDMLEEEDELDAEQVILDDHDDQIAPLSVRLEKLCASCGPKSFSCRVIHCRFQHSRRALPSIEEATDKPALYPTNICLLQQHEESLGNLRHELADARSSLYSLHIVNDDEICRLLVIVIPWLPGACTGYTRKWVDNPEGIARGIINTLPSVSGTHPE